MTDDMMSCSNCVYFRPGAHSAAKEGICRRDPPQLQTEDEVETEQQVETVEDDFGITTTTMHSVVTYTGWPDVMRHDWCGEWSGEFEARRDRARGR